MSRYVWLLVAAGTIGCAESTTAPQASPRLHDHIVFTSNRSGEDEFYRMKPDGSEVHVIPTPGVDGLAQSSISPDGEWLAFAGIDDFVGYDIFVMRVDGSELQNLTDVPVYQEHPAWSPDGSRIAYSENLGGNANDTDLFVMDRDGSNRQRLTQSPGHDTDPSWAPDGSAITFQSDRDGQFEIYVLPLGGSTPVRITQHPDGDVSPQWSPDGSTIMFVRFQSGSNSGIYLMNPDGTNVRQVPLAFQADSRGGIAWSPDGTRIIVTEESVFDIWTMRPDGSEAVRLTDSPNVLDLHPVWSPK